MQEDAGEMTCQTDCEQGLGLERLENRAGVLMEPGAEPAGQMGAQEQRREWAVVQRHAEGHWARRGEMGGVAISGGVVVG